MHLPNFPQNGLRRNVQGIAGLGHASISLPNQLASHFGVSPKFALCLPSKSSINGVMFFGEGPYYMLPNADVSRSVSYTPLTIRQEGHYYIPVTSININDNPVPNAHSGRGGTRLSTTKLFTVLEHSIYQSFTKLFTSQLSGIPQMKLPWRHSKCAMTPGN